MLGVDDSKLSAIPYKVLPIFEIIPLENSAGEFMLSLFFETKIFEELYEPRLFLYPKNKYNLLQNCVFEMGNLGNACVFFFPGYPIRKKGALGDAEKGTHCYSQRPEPH